MSIGKILFSTTILFGSLFLGILFRKHKEEAYCQNLSKNIIIFLIKVITPIIVCLSFWVIDISQNLGILTLPLIGFLLSTIIILPAKFLANFHHLNRPQAGSYITSAMFSNIGYTLGGFLAFVLLGEVAFGLTVLYCLYFKPFYYTVGFYVAEYYGTEVKSNIVESLKKIFTEGLRLFPLLGLLLGALLNFSNVNRPLLFDYVNRIFIPLSTFGFLFAIGMTLKFSALKQFRPQLFTMSLLKFVISPLIGIAIAYLMGYAQLMDKLPLKVVFIESAMPVAIGSLMLPALFNLDRDLSSSCWIFTTLLVIPLLPLFILILNLW
jgi:hypothetical protein